MLLEMPRTKRVDYAGARYHVFDRGVRRADLFLDDRDRRLFLRLVAETCLERSWRCLAYCLMGNHYHLAIRTDVPGLSEGMHAIHGEYAGFFNREYDLSGHVFQARFKAKLIEHDSYLLEVLRYVVLNPVAARLCTRVEEWPWSSYAAMIGMRSHRDWFDRRAVLSLFSADDALALSRYVRFVAAGTPALRLEDERTIGRRTRNAAMRKAYATGDHTISSLADLFRVSKATIKRALRGPGPS